MAHRLGALFKMGEELVEFSLDTLAHAAQKQCQQCGQGQLAVAGECVGEVRWIGPAAGGSVSAGTGGIAVLLEQRGGRNNGDRNGIRNS